VFLDEVGLPGCGDFVGRLQRMYMARSRGVSSTMWPVSRVGERLGAGDLTGRTPVAAS
jgi:hypothetical protein